MNNQNFRLGLANKLQYLLLAGRSIFQFYNKKVKHKKTEAVHIAGVIFIP
jgi:hypothetical protein